MVISNGEVEYPRASFTRKPTKAVSIAMWVKSQKRDHIRWFDQRDGSVKNVNTRKGSAVLPKSTWTHIAGTFNTKTGTARIYINGKLKQEQHMKNNSGIPQDFTTSGVGRRFGDKYLTYVDDVYIFDRIISATAVKALFEKCEFKRMILHYGFQKVNMSLQSFQLKDQSGLENNATLKGMFIYNIKLNPLIAQRSIGLKKPTDKPYTDLASVPNQQQNRLINLRPCSYVAQSSNLM